MSASIVQARARQVVVVFGAGGGDASIGGVLASLVSESETEVAGVFLEDHTLFRMAGLPFAIEVSRVTTSRRLLTAAELERELKVIAARAENVLRGVAEQTGFRWSFRKLRGRLGAVLADMRDVDFLLVGAARGAMVPAGELGATARTLRASEREARRPVAVAFDESPAGNRALDAGVRLAEKTGRRLVVFRSPASASPELYTRIQPLGAGRVTLQTVPNADESALLHAVRGAAPVVLIIGADEAGFDEAKIDQLRRELRCPMVVAR